MHRGYAVPLAVLGGIAVVVSASNALAGSPAVILPTTTDVHLSSTQDITLCPSGGVMTTILSFTLPPGNWVLTSTATLYVPEAFHNFRCHLVTDDLEIAVARVMNNAGGTDASTLTLTGAFECSSDREVRLECWHDRDIDFFILPSVDAGATTWAHKSGELQILTQ